MLQKFNPKNRDLIVNINGRLVHRDAHGGIRLHGYTGIRHRLDARQRHRPPPDAASQGDVHDPCLTVNR